jgi:large subunit ribosomal protein L15
MITLNALKPSQGARKKRKRIGRGEGSGHGGTSTKGHKGIKARSGGKAPVGYEGGQMPMQRRLPKRGFKNPFREEFEILNLKDLARFSAGAVVDVEALKSAGLVRGGGRKVKMLGEGTLSQAITVRVHHFSLAAKSKIEEAGGKAEVI